MSDQELKGDGIHMTTSNDLDHSSNFENDAGGVDADDMYRMGKEQQFRVRYLILSGN
jgi:hypothetical protein